MKSHRISQNRCVLTWNWTQCWRRPRLDSLFVVNFQIELRKHGNKSFICFNCSLWANNKSYHTIHQHYYYKKFQNWRSNQENWNQNNRGDHYTYKNVMGMHITLIQRLPINVCIVKGKGDKEINKRLGVGTKTGSHGAKFEILSGSKQI